MARLRGFLWLMAGLVIALVAGVIAFQTLSQAAEAPTAQEAGAPTVEVVVAARPLPLRTLLTAEDLVVADLPVTAVPEGALRSVDDAVGRLTLVDLYLGEPLLAPRLLDPNLQSADGRLAVFAVEDEVLMAVPAQDLLSRMSVLKPGDRVDILFSLPFPTELAAGATGGDDQQATFALLQNVTIAALMGSQATQSAATRAIGQEASQPAGPPQALLVTLQPQDALVLKYMIDAGGTLDLVLRAPGVDRPFDVDPVDVDYVVDRYDLPIELGQ